MTDGPFLYANGKQLIMLWSGRGPKGYAMGSAVSENGILGPWKQNDRLAFEEDGGHGMLFTTFDGRLMMTVHQPNQTPWERPVFVPARVEDGAVVIDAEGAPALKTVPSAGVKTEKKDMSTENKENKKENAAKTAKTPAKKGTPAVKKPKTAAKKQAETKAAPATVKTAEAPEPEKMPEKRDLPYWLL